MKLQTLGAIGGVTAGVGSVLVGYAMHSATAALGTAMLCVGLICAMGAIWDSRDP